MRFMVSHDSIRIESIKAILCGDRDKEENVMKKVGMIVGGICALAAIFYLIVLVTAWI